MTAAADASSRQALSHEALRREALRQQLLVQAVRRASTDHSLKHWLRDAATQQAQGLQAYRANAMSVAERALACAYPTLVELLSEVSFAALARVFWSRHAPSDGDMALFGEQLAEFIEHDNLLASEPYLADVARLEWAVHRCGFAADAPNQVSGLQLLGDASGPSCCLLLRPGTVLCPSDWPVVSIWQAHRRADAGRLDGIALALRPGQAESALVVRDGWRVVVEALDAAAARFTDEILRGQPLAHALDQAGEGFDFEAWLMQAVQQQWLVEVQPARSLHAQGSPA